MKILQVYKEIVPNLIDSSCVALGMFDGVHIAHREVILDAVNKANKLGNKSAIITFCSNPKSVVIGKRVKQINTLDDKLHYIAQLGVDVAIVLEFNDKLLNMSAEDYLEKFLINGINAKSITVGYNHHFGVGKRGTPQFLQEKVSVYGYEFKEVSPIQLDSTTVSSSIIRKYITHGQMDKAQEFLGRPFSIKNTVVHGEKRGRQLGFPTANINIPDDIVAPKNGIYLATAEFDNEKYVTVVNVGKRPTFADLEKSLIEAYLFDFDGDLYGKEVRINFLNRIRDEKKFDSINELISQIDIDCCTAKSLAKQISL